MGSMRGNAGVCFQLGTGAAECSIGGVKVIDAQTGKAPGGGYADRSLEEELLIADGQQQGPVGQAHVAVDG